MNQGKPKTIPQRSFQMHMDELMKQPEIKKAYEDAIPSLPKIQQSSVSKLSSKPFQIKSSTATSFTQKKPYDQFYKGKIRTIDSSIPRPQSYKEQNTSVVSTQKSYDPSNDCDSKSLKSETFSISQSTEQKKQPIPIDGWVLNNPRKKIELQTKEYKEIMKEMEEMISIKEQNKQQIQEELAQFIQHPQKLKIQEDLKIDKKIDQLAQQLQELELEQYEKRAELHQEKIKYFLQEPIDNDSTISVKQRSMFITELLKNRQQIYNNNQDENDVLITDSHLSTLKRKLDQTQRKFHQIKNQALPQESEKQLEGLLSDIENFKPRQYNKETPYSHNHEILDILHKKILNYNPKFKETDDLQLDRPGILPKDPILRRDAQQRIIDMKNQQVNESLLALSQQRTLCEKPKIKQLNETLKKEFAYTPSLYLITKISEIEQIDKSQNEAISIINILKKDQKILEDCSELKLLLEQATILGYEIDQRTKKSEIQIQSEQEELQKQKLQVQSMQTLLEDLYNNTISLLEKPQEYEILPELPRIEELPPIEIQFSKPQEKSNEEMDQEITERLRIQYPNLFQDD